MGKTFTDSYLKSIKPDAGRRIEIRDISRIDLFFGSLPQATQVGFFKSKIRQGDDLDKRSAALHRCHFSKHTLRRLSWTMRRRMEFIELHNDKGH